MGSLKIDWKRTKCTLSSLWAILKVKLGVFHSKIVPQRPFVERFVSQKEECNYETKDFPHPSWLHHSLCQHQTCESYCNTSSCKVLKSFTIHVRGTTLEDSQMKSLVSISSPPKSSCQQRTRLPKKKSHDEKNAGRIGPMLYTFRPLQQRRAEPFFKTKVWWCWQRWIFKWLILGKL